MSKQRGAKGMEAVRSANEALQQIEVLTAGRQILNNKGVDKKASPRG